MVRSTPGLASEIWTWAAAEWAGLVRRFGLEPEPEPEPEPDLGPDNMTPFGPTISTLHAEIEATKPAAPSPWAGHNPHRDDRAPHSATKTRTGDAAAPLRSRSKNHHPAPSPPPPSNPARTSPAWLHHLATFPQLQIPTALLPRPLDLALPQDPTTPFLLTTTTSITLNHLRRTFYPALAAPVYHTPLDELRIARSNPAYFLDEALAVEWTALAASYIQKGVWDLVGWLLLSFLSSSGGGRGRGVVVGVVGMVWVLASVEYVFMRSCSAVAFVVAGWKLVSGSEVGRRALVGVLERRWEKGVVVGLEVGWWVWRGLVPLGRESVRAAVGGGRPGMLLGVVGVVGGVVAVLEWRGVFFIALEVSGVFIAVGYLVVAVGVWLGGGGVGGGGETVRMARPESVVELRTSSTRGTTRRRRSTRHGQVRHQKVE